MLVCSHHHFSKIIFDWNWFCFWKCKFCFNLMWKIEKGNVLLLALSQGCMSICIGFFTQVTHFIYLSKIFKGDTDNWPQTNQNSIICRKGIFFCVSSCTEKILTSDRLVICRGSKYLLVPLCKIQQKKFQACYIAMLVLTWSVMA